MPTSGRVVAEVGRSRVLDALSRHRSAFARRHGVDPEREPVLRRVLACRTGALGAHLRLCGGCGWHGLASDSCRDRHCPQCQGREAAAWADARRLRMLDVPHFQVVFTLPAELRPLAFHNQVLAYDLLFAAAVGVLRDLAAQRLGGRLGVTAVLHTWTAELGYHPHVHCLVTAGALHEDGSRWVRSRPAFLFPGRVMGALFRGRFLDGLRTALAAGRLSLPLDESVSGVSRMLGRLTSRLRRWVVHVEPPKGRPVEHVTRYLARYVKRVAISDGRVLAITAEQVVVRGRNGPVQLDGAEFVRRFLLHVLPKGLRKVRHYGLYAPGGAGLALEEARTLLGGGTASADAREPDREPERESCPACGAARVVRVHPRQPGWSAVIASLSRSARGPP